MPFEKNSLGDSTILYFWLSDEDRVIHQIVVYFDFSYPVVFESAFNNMILEIGIEPEYLSFVFDPGRLNSGNRVILGLLSGLLEGQTVDTFCEFIDQMFIYVFRNILPFFLLTVIVVAELLGFVEVLFVGIVEHVPRKKRNLLG